MHKIRLSRHAKRRLKLYSIPEPAILSILRERNFPPGKQELVRGIPEFELPIKIIFDVHKDDLLVITAYPVKRGKE